MRAQGGVPDERLIGDVAGAAAYLRALPTANGKVGGIGYCSGGRQSVLAACNLDLDAAVDCYGAFVTGTPPRAGPCGTNLVDQLPNLRGPVARPVRQRGQVTRAPSRSPNSSGFSPSTARSSNSTPTTTPAMRSSRSTGPSYRVAAANEGWQQVAACYGKHLLRGA